MVKLLPCNKKKGKVYIIEASSFSLIFSQAKLPFYVLVQNGNFVILILKISESLNISKGVEIRKVISFKRNYHNNALTS